MANDNEDLRRKIPLKKFLSDFRSPLEDRELMERYGLSARSFVNLITTLAKKKLLTRDDLDKRKEIAVQRDLAKEVQFLSSLYICQNCSHPSPSPFDKCPACGAESAYTSKHDEVYPPITTSAAHAYVQPTDVMEVVEAEEIIEETTEPHEEEEPLAQDAKKREKSSPVSTVRSLFGKLKKK